MSYNFTLLIWRLHQSNVVFISPRKICWSTDIGGGHQILLLIKRMLIYQSKPMHFIFVTIVIFFQRILHLWQRLADSQTWLIFKLFFIWKLHKILWVVYFIKKVQIWLRRLPLCIWQNWCLFFLQGLIFSILKMFSNFYRAASRNDILKTFTKLIVVIFENNECLLHLMIHRYYFLEAFIVKWNCLFFFCNLLIMLRW